MAEGNFSLVSENDPIETWLYETSEKLNISVEVIASYLLGLLVQDMKNNKPDLFEAIWKGENDESTD